MIRPERLLVDLPDVTTVGDSEDHARSCLRLVLEQPVKVRPAEPTDWTVCPNCGEVAPSTRSPYCSDFCRECSAFVRQFRSSATSGQWLERERQIALGQKLWHLLGGGYPHRLTLAPPGAFKQVQKRTAGLCEQCGNPASTYDHLGSG